METRLAEDSLVALAQLDKLTIAIGEDHFGAQLITTARAISDADHVMAFAFSVQQPPRLVISAGDFDEQRATRASTVYATSLYLLDPNYAEIRRAHEYCDTWFDSAIGDACNHFRTAFFDECGVSDVAAFASRQADIVYYVLFLRGGGQRFASGQRWLLRQLGVVVAAMLHKHYSYMHALSGRSHFVIDRVLAEAKSFSGLTPRERRVCLGILTGYTSESIAINLGISINSVLTYRKRLYEKLAISSQNELFVRVIAAMVDLSRDDVAPILGSDLQARPLNGGASATAERFDEYYMAEAFISDDMM